VCIFRKYQYPPQGRLLEILKARGVSKAKIFKRNYEAKLEFLDEWEGSNQKTFRGRGMDIFWNNTPTQEILNFNPFCTGSMDISLYKTVPVTFIDIR